MTVMSRLFIQCSFFFLLLPLISITLLPVPANSEVTDIRALNGLNMVKAVFDLRVKEPKRFAFFLEVIEKTHEAILQQGLESELVVAVRGPAIRFMSGEIWAFSEADQKHLKDSAGMIKNLSAKGVIFEACSIAAGLFRVDRQTYLEGVTPVDNTFVSLVGYQAQGYGLVPVN